MLLKLLQGADSLQTVADVINQAAQNPVAQERTVNFFEMFRLGGPLMWVLLALSVVAVYIIGKKWWTIAKASKVDKDFMNDIRDYIQDGKLKSAVTLCRKVDNPVARMIETGISRLGRPMNEIQSAIENTGNIEVARLEKGLPALASIAGGAPMIGFLGTVLGMVRAFFNMSTAGSNIDITLLSGGIYTAMITSVVVLIVGILAYFAYNFLTAKVSDVVAKMENTTIQFMDLLNEPAEKETAEEN
jgi:biopolymer transport protein ExbB